MTWNGYVPNIWESFKFDRSKWYKRSSESFKANYVSFACNEMYGCFHFVFQQLWRIEVKSNWIINCVLTKRTFHSLSVNCESTWIPWFVSCVNNLAKLSSTLFTHTYVYWVIIAIIMFIVMNCCSLERVDTSLQKHVLHLNIPMESKSG